MINFKKSCYTCNHSVVSKNKFPCDKCHDMSNYVYRFNTQMLCGVGIGLIVLVLCCL